MNWTESEAEVKSKLYRSDIEVKSKWFESELEVNSKRTRYDASVKPQWNRRGYEVKPKGHRRKVGMKSRLNRSELEVNSNWSSKCSASEVSSTRSNPRGKSKRKGIEPLPTPNVPCNFSWPYRYYCFRAKQQSRKLWSCRHEGMKTPRHPRPRTAC